MDLVKICSRSMLLAPCLALTLYGCGSGGGGGGDDDVDPTLQITRTNAGQVASAAYGTNDDMGEVGEIPGRIFSADGANALRASGLVGLVLRFLPDDALDGKHRIAPMGVGDEPCVTGSAVVTLNDSNGNDEVDVEGESGSVVFTDCVNDDGAAINGTMTFTLDENSDSAVEFTLGFVDLTVVGGIDDEDFSVSGSLTFGLRLIEEPATLILTLSGDDLVLVEHGEPLDLVGDFEFTLTVTSGESSVEFSVNLMIDSLGGIVNVTTTIALAGDPPTSGTVVIDGVDSTLTLTITGGGAVTVALDEDGNGTTDCSQVLTLNTLDQFNPAMCP